jgi:hypothetical protein
LARELGYANVDRMLEGMTARQFEEWKAFFKIENERYENKSKQEAPQPHEVARSLESSLDTLMEK